MSKRLPAQDPELLADLHDMSARLLRASLDDPEQNAWCYNVWHGLAKELIPVTRTFVEALPDADD